MVALAIALALLTPHGHHRHHAGIKGVVVAAHSGLPGHKATIDPLAHVLVIVQSGPVRVAETRTGKHGHFKVALRPGRYLVFVRNDRSNHACRTNLRVRPHRIRHVRLACRTK